MDDSFTSTVFKGCFQSFLAILYPMQLLLVIRERELNMNVQSFWVCLVLVVGNILLLPKENTSKGFDVNNRILYSMRSCGQYMQELRLS